VWSLGGAHDLRLHVVGHLLLGMVAPLLLVTAAPITLALRALPREHARTLGRLLRRRPLAVLTHPVVAALLDVGGLWVMYRTALLSEVSPLLLQVHMLLAGYLFAVALIGPDPAPHRPGLVVRAGVLVAAVAAHDVLAKLLYAAPPPGVPVAQAEAAGLLMYYGAAPVHVALFVLLGREWSAGQRRARARRLLSQEAAPRSAAATACSAALHVEKASHSPGAAARISAGEGWPSMPPRTTPASRASNIPAATSQILVPASTAQSKRPQAR
jgi:putative membrane protein